MRRDGAQQAGGPRLWWIVGVAAGLAAIHGILAALWGPGQFVAVLPWYLPLMHGFAALAGLGIAFLALGRYAVLREPASFWIGFGFCAFAILLLFQILSTPGLLPDDRGLISQLGNTSTWLALLFLSALALFLPLAVLARWPRAGARGERWWPWLVAAGMVIVALMGWLSVAFEQYLPLLIVGREFTPLYDSWFYGLTVAYVAGAVLSTRRYRQTGDSLLGFTAIVQLVLVFFAITSLIGGERYDTWWYWRRILLAGGLIAMLFGLLSEYVGLYRRERYYAGIAGERAAQLAAIIDSMADAVVLVDPRGRIVNVNRAGIEMLGLARKEEILLSVAEVAAMLQVRHPDGRPVPLEENVLLLALRGQISVGHEGLLRRADGSDVYFSMSAAPVQDEAGNVTMAVAVVRDLTELKRLERLRDEFLSTAAHELKTPVTTIKGYAQMMREWEPEAHDPREALAIDVINSQCDRISRRVQEMLEVARSRPALPVLHRVRFDLGDLASEVVQRVQATAEIHRLAFHAEAPAPVEADRDRIEEVLASLLENALKYSPKGGEVEVRVWVQEGEARVSVRDHGVGIPRERQQHIFEPFFEAVPPGARGYRGVVALSLYLSKLTIERHGGRLWFESEEGKGSTFHLSLPLAKGNGDAGG